MEISTYTGIYQDSLARLTITAITANASHDSSNINAIEIVSLGRRLSVLPITTYACTAKSNNLIPTKLSSQYKNTTVHTFSSVPAIPTTASHCLKRD